MRKETALLSLFLLLVIFFALAKSDMIAIAIVILKPYGFSDILFAYKTRRTYNVSAANITRRKPNITAKQ